ncbi:hypothetical protein KC957_00765, partial [Candidatus Saccharibacteria bacterium]|nr:hypothetical protein [Candidatus Saccharibacteria bacterium]
MPQQTLDRQGHEYDEDWTPGHDEDMDGIEEALDGPDAEYPEDHPSSTGTLSDAVIGQKESSPGPTEKNNEASSDEVNGLYTKRDSDRPTGFHLSRNQGIAGGIVGLLIAGSIGSASFASGPLKLLHLGQMLKTFHFSDQEDAGSDRMSKIARYIRYRDKPERARLGKLGNTYADRIEARFNKAGLESSYSKRGDGDGYVIDPANLPEES